MDGWTGIIHSSVANICQIVCCVFSLYLGFVVFYVYVVVLKAHLLNLSSGFYTLFN